MFRVKRVNLHLRNDVRQIYIYIYIYIYTSVDARHLGVSLSEQYNTTWVHNSTSTPTSLKVLCNAQSETSHHKSAMFVSSSCLENCIALKQPHPKGDTVIDTRFTTLTTVHPLITECSIVRALCPRNAPPDWKEPKKPEMEPLQGERIVFYAHLHKKAEEWAIQRWPGHFYSQLQQPPCTVSQSGAPTHLPFLTDCANW